MLGQSLIPPAPSNPFFNVPQPAPTGGAAGKGIQDLFAGFFKQLLPAMEKAGDVLGQSFLRTITPALNRSQTGQQRTDGGGGIDPRQLGQAVARRADVYLDRPVNTRVPVVDDIHQGATFAKEISRIMGNAGQAARGLSGVAGALGGVARVAGPAGVVLAGAVQGIAKLVETADKARNEQRRFAYVSPSMAANYQQSDWRQMLRDLKHGEAIAGSNQKLNESLDKLSDALQPLEALITNLMNGALGAAVNGLNNIIDILKEWFPWVKKLLEDGPPKNGPAQQWWRNLAVQGLQNQQLQNGLQPRLRGINGK